MPDVITALDALTPDQLTEILRHSGHLPQGRVSHISISQRATTHISTTGLLKLGYVDAPPTAPRTLFLKLPTVHDPRGAHEIAFYQRLVPPMQAQFERVELPFVYCYDLALDEASGHAHLLLEDMSATHFDYDERAPNAIHYEYVVEAFAQIHAFWWEHDQLGAEIGDLPTATALDTARVNAQAKAQDFIRFMGKNLTTEQQQILRQATASIPTQRRAKLLDPRHLTIIHRDPHPRNMLHPRDLDEGYAKLIDWQSWQIGVGTDDLAYMMAVHWIPEQREALEARFVQDYHKLLVEFGVGDYTLDDVWADYRASVIQAVVTLISAWSDEHWAQGWWWHKLQAALVAYTDLGCRELLD